MNFPLLARTKFAGLTGLLLSGLTAQAATLAPHRAFYLLEAHRLSDSSGVTAISGKLALEVTGADCTGYAVNYRVAHQFVQGESGMQISDVQMNSFESGNGLEFDLRQKYFLDGKLHSESKITVRKKSADSEGEGSIDDTTDMTFKIQPGTLFPTLFQKGMVDAAIRGETRYSAIVYEGSEREKEMRAVIFIGPKKSKIAVPTSTDPDTANKLATLPYWPMTISYYHLDSQSDEPNYQASFNMLENGISTDLIMDYGSYALKGTLSKVELLEPDTCN